MPISPGLVCGEEMRAWRDFSLRQIFVPYSFQACHVEGGSAGLIPSQLLEEKRKAFVKRDLELTPTSGMRVPTQTPNLGSDTALPGLTCPSPYGQGPYVAAFQERKRSE